IQLARDFRLRPDLITYPLPQFSGQASVPSTIDLFIDGYRSRSERVQPGPFTLTGMPFVNGAGEAQLITTHALGRQVTSTMPFYLSSDLVRPGLRGYSVSLGLLRPDFGRRNFACGAPAFSGPARRGIDDHFTVEGQL